MIGKCWRALTGLISVCIFAFIFWTVAGNFSDWKQESGVKFSEFSKWGEFQTAIVDYLNYDKEALERGELFTAMIDQLISNANVTPAGTKVVSVSKDLRTTLIGLAGRGLALLHLEVNQDEEINRNCLLRDIADHYGLGLRKLGFQSVKKDNVFSIKRYWKNEEYPYEVEIKDDVISIKRHWKHEEYPYEVEISVSYLDDEVEVVMFRSSGHD